MLIAILIAISIRAPRSDRAAGPAALAKMVADCYLRVENENLWKTRELAKMIAQFISTSK